MVCIWRDRGKRDPGCLRRGAIAVGINGYNEVRDEIAAQNITATDDAAELTDGALQPGQAIKTGADAKAFADIMEHHTLESTEGARYAEMGRFLTRQARTRVTRPWRRRRTTAARSRTVSATCG